MVLNAAKIVETMGKENIYLTKARRLPLLVGQIMRTDTTLDLRRDLSMIGLSQDRMIIPISPDCMIEFECRRLLQSFNNTGFRLFAHPMQKAIEEVLRFYPDAVQRWLPSVGFEDYVKEIDESLNQSKPKIVTFQSPIRHYKPESDISGEKRIGTVRDISVPR